ncbi:MAG TPA: TRAP transporter small permease [Rhodocyclaceae bacterium]|nr:TRAP transporter small permease [Rhodocyclaceae bacterium]
MFLRILDRLEEILIASLMAAATIVIFLAVVHRYLSTIPGIQDYTLRLHVSWAQELCIYMFVWMAKFGAAYGVRTGIHVGVDVVINRLEEKNRARIVIFGLLAGALFTGIVGALGARFVWDMAHTDAVSPDLELPKWIVYLCIPLGSWLMCFRFVQVAWTFGRTGKLPHHDHSHVEGVEEIDIEADILGDLARSAKTPLGGKAGAA